MSGNMPRNFLTKLASLIDAAYPGETTLKTKVANYARLWGRQFVVSEQCLNSILVEQLKKSEQSWVPKLTMGDLHWITSAKGTSFENCLAKNCRMDHAEKAFVMPKKL